MNDPRGNVEMVILNTKNRQTTRMKKKKSFTLFTISSDTHSGAVVRSLTVAS